MLVGALGAILFENLLTVKGVKSSKLPGQGVIKASEGAIRASQSF